MLKVLLRLTLSGTVALSFIALTALAQESQALFEKKCANCHGKDGSGHTMAAAKMAVPDLRSRQIRDKSDAELTDSIANGTKHRDYPHAFLHAGMTSDQIASLVKHIRSLQANKKAPEKK